jgi:hypothetical protein
MNNILKKEKSIELDANYSIETDGGNGLSLILREERERTNKLSKEKEKFVFVDRLYFNTIGQLLYKYIQLSQNKSKDLKDIVDNTNKILSIVQDFRDKYKNW